MLCPNQRFIADAQLFECLVPVDEVPFQSHRLPIILGPMVKFRLGASYFESCCAVS
jgi:hypothetical protein